MTGATIIGPSRFAFSDRLDNLAGGLTRYFWGSYDAGGGTHQLSGLRDPWKAEALQVTAYVTTADAGPPVGTLVTTLYKNSVAAGSIVYQITHFAGSIGSRDTTTTTPGAASPFFDVGDTFILTIQTTGSTVFSHIAWHLEGASTRQGGAFEAPTHPFVLGDGDDVFFGGTTRPYLGSWDGTTGYIMHSFGFPWKAKRLEGTCAVIVAGTGSIQYRLYRGAVDGTHRVYHVAQSGASTGMKQSETTTPVDLSGDFAAGELLMLRIVASGSAIFGSPYMHLDCEALT